MNYLRIGSFLTFALLAAGSSSAQTEGNQEGRPADSEANAALLYWQAFAVMPQLDEEQWTLLDPEADALPAEKLKELAQRHALALRMLHRAGKIPSCRWGSQIEQDLLNVTLPHLSQARQLAAAASLRSRLRLADDDAEGAMDDLIAVMRLGRAVSTDPILICLVMDLQFEKTALDIIEAHMASFDAPVRSDLASKLKLLPQRTAFSRFVETDAHLTLETLERAVTAADPKTFSPKDLELGESLEDVRSNCQKAREVARKLAQIASRPDERTAERLIELEQQTRQSDNPVVRLLSLNFGRTYRRLVEQEQRLAQLASQLEERKSN